MNQARELIGLFVFFLRIFLGGSVLSVQTQAGLYQPSWALSCGSRGKHLGTRAGGETEWVLLTAAWPWEELSMETCTTPKFCHLGMLLCEGK